MAASVDWPLSQKRSTEVFEMFSRGSILCLLLLYQVAISLLGSSGLHGVLGCHHEHQLSPAGAAPQASSGHRHSRCRHAHSHSHSAPTKPEQQDSQSPLTDDSCAICQFFTRPAEAVSVFQWSSLTAVLSSVEIEVAKQSSVVFESVYEVRGPPSLA